MLANSINGQLVAERQRSLLQEASARGLAREAGTAGSPVAQVVEQTFRQLRAAAAVRIRPIRPEDAAMLSDGFDRLSPQSRRQRFFVAKKRLTDSELRYLTDVDHHDHEALVAVHRFGGQGLGVARYIRDPVDRDQADVAVTIADEWQGRGLGTVLATRLAARARRAGVHRFTAMILEENDGARRLLPKIGAIKLVSRDRDTLNYEVLLAPVAAERRAYRWSTLAPAGAACG